MNTSSMNTTTAAAPAAASAHFRRRPLARFLSNAAALAATSAAGFFASAPDANADYWWTGLGGDDLWSTAANWATNAAGTTLASSAPTSGSIVRFTAAAAENARHITISTASGSTVIVQSLHVETAGYTLEIGAGATFQSSNGTGESLVVREDLTINGDGFFTYHPSSGSNASDNTVASDKTLKIDAQVSGSQWIEIWGGSYNGGTFLFTNPANISTFTGSVQVNSNMIFAFTETGTLGTAAFALNNTATFRHDSDKNAVMVQNLSGNTVTFTQNGSGRFEWAGTRNSTTILNNTADLGTGESVYSGVISGGNLTKQGDGTWELTAANTYTGTTTIEGGALKLSGTGKLGTGAVTLKNASRLLLAANGTTYTAGSGLVIDATGGAIEVPASTSVSFSTVISGVGTFAKQGAGELTLSATNTHTGAVAVSGGTLRLGTANTLSASSVVTTASGGKLAPFVGAANDLKSLTVASGGVLEVGTAGHAAAQTVSFASTTTVNLAAGGLLLFNVSADPAVDTVLDLSALSRSNFASGGTGTIYVSASGLSATSGAAIILGNAGLATANLMSAPEIQRTAVVEWDAANTRWQLLPLGAPVDAVGDITIGGGANWDTVSTGNTEIPKYASFNAREYRLVELPAAATVTFTGKALTAGSEGVFKNLFDADGGKLAFNNPEGDGAGAVTLLGNLTLVAGGSGKLNLDISNNITVTLSGVLADETAAKSGEFATGASAGTLRFARESTAPVEIPAVISGSANVAVGAGVTEFSKANTYTGTTTVEGGTLRLVAGNTLATSSHVYVRGATAAPAGIPVGGPLALGESVSSTLVLNTTATNTFTALTVESGGILEIGSAPGHTTSETATISITGTGEKVTLASGSTLLFNGGGTGATTTLAFGSSALSVPTNGTGITLSASGLSFSSGKISITGANLDGNTFKNATLTSTGVIGNPKVEWNTTTSAWEIFAIPYALRVWDTRQNSGGPASENWGTNDYANWTSTPFPEAVTTGDSYLLLGNAGSASVTSRTLVIPDNSDGSKGVIKLDGSKLSSWAGTTGYNGGAQTVKNPGGLFVDSTTGTVSVDSTTGEVTVTTSARGSPNSAGSTTSSTKWTIEGGILDTGPQQAGARWAILVWRSDWNNYNDANLNIKSTLVGGGNITLPHEGNDGYGLSIKGDASQFTGTIKFWGSSRKMGLTENVSIGNAYIYMTAQTDINGFTAKTIGNVTTKNTVLGATFVGGTTYITTAADAFVALTGGSYAGANVTATANTTFSLNDAAAGVTFVRGSALGTGQTNLNNTTLQFISSRPDGTAAGDTTPVTVTGGNINLNNAGAKIKVGTDAITWLYGAPEDYGLSADTVITSPKSFTYNDNAGNPASVTFSGNFIGTQILRKVGVGELILTGTGSTSSSGTSIDEGILTLTADGNIGTGTHIINGGTLRFANTAETTYTKAWNIRGTTSAIDVSAATVATLSGVISGGALVKTGAGVLGLTGTNTYTGGLFINAGAVRVQGANSEKREGHVITVNDGGTLLFAGNDTWGSNYTDPPQTKIVVNEGGIVQLGESTASGAERSNLGDITLTGGTIVSENGNSAGPNSGTYKTPWGAAAFRGVITVKASEQPSEIKTIFTGTGRGEGSFALGGNEKTFTPTTNSQATFVVEENARLIVSAALADGKVTNTGFLGSDNQNHNGSAIPSSLNKEGAGEMELQGKQAYTGATNVRGGTLVLSGEHTTYQGAFGTSGTTGVAYFASWAYNVSGENSKLKVTDEGKLYYDAATAETRGVVTLDGKETTLELALNDSATALTLNNIVTGTGKLLKTGDGVLTLPEIKTYTGGTTVKGGTLILEGGASADGKGALTGEVSVTEGAVLRVNNEYAFGTADGASIGKIDLARAELKLGYGAGVLATTGALAFKLTGATISAVNGGVNDGEKLALGSTAAGATTVEVGASSFVSTIAASVGAVELSQKSTLFNVIGALNIETPVTDGAGGGEHELVKDGAGTLTLVKENTYGSVVGATGSTTVRAGTLVLGAAATLSGAKTITLSGGTLRLDGIGGINQLNDDATLKLAGGALVLKGQNETLAALLVSAGATSGIIDESGQGGTPVFTGGATFESGSQLTVTGVHATVTGAANLNGALLYLSGSGTSLALNGGATLNTTGRVVLGTGTRLFVTSLNAVKGALENGGGSALAFSGALAKSGGADDTLALSGGVFTAATLNVTGGAVSVTGGASLEIFGAAALAGETAAVRASGAGVSLAFDNGLSLGGGLVKVSGGASFALTGGLVLNGGGVEISDGAAFSVASLAATDGFVRVGGVPARIAGNVTKTGASGKLTLAAEKFEIGGALSVSGGGALAVAGGANGVELAVAGATTFASGTTLEFDMTGAERDTPRLKITGGAFDGTSLASVTINIETSSAGALTNGTYILMDAPTALVNTSALRLNGVPLGEPVRATDGSAFIGLSLFPSIPNQLGLTYVSADTNTTVVWNGSSATLSGIWKNDDGVLPAAAASNWTGNVAGINVRTFLDGDNVVFSDAAPASRRVVTVATEGVSVAGVLVNTSASYRITGGEIGGAGGLEKAGGGELTLDSKNTYTGATVVSGGRLTLRDLAAAGAGSELSVGTGAVLRLDIAQEKSGVFDKNITGGGALEKASGGTVRLENVFAHTGDTTIAAGKLEVTGALSGTRNLSVVGAALEIRDGGTVSAAGNVTFGLAGVFMTNTSGLLSAGGTLAFNGGVGQYASRVDITGYTSPETTVVASAEAITSLAGGFTATVAGEVVPAGVALDHFMNTDVRVAGTAGQGQTLQVQNALVWDNTVQGKQHGHFNVTAGNSFVMGADPDYATVLANNPAAANGLGFAGWDGRSLTKIGGGELVLAVANTYTGATRVEAGRLTLRDAGAAGAGAAGVFIAGGATLAFDIAAENSGGVFAKSFSGPGALVKTGAGEIILAAASEHTGGTRVEAGVLTLRDIAAAGSAPGVGVEAGATLRLDTGAASWTFAKQITGEGALVKAGSGTLTLSAPNARSGATRVEAGVLTLRDIGATGSGAVLEVDAGASLNLEIGAGDRWAWEKEISGAGGLVKSGAGELVLAFANAYTGDTHVTGGSLVALNFASTGTSPEAVLRLEAGTSLRLDLDEASGGVFTKQITGAGDLVKNGVGTLVLTRANSYNGGTSVNAGSLVLRNVNGAGIGNLVSVASGANLEFDVAVATESWTFQRRVSGAGEIVKSGAGALTLSGANDYTGATRVTGGVFSVEGTLGRANSTGGFTHGAPLRLEGGDLALNQAVNQTLSGVVSGSGSLFKSGAGVLTLSAANTYAGGTTVSGGVLTLTGSLGAGANGANYAGNFLLNGGDLVLNQAGRQTLSGVIGGAGSLTKTGSGTLVLTGPVAHTGGTVIQGGTLQIGATHGDSDSRPQTLNLPSVTLHAGAALAFDILGDNLSDKLFTGSISFVGDADAGDSVVIDVNKLANGAYILIESVAGFDATFSNPDAFFTTLVNGAPLEADSPLQTHYAYSADGRNLILQVTGAADSGGGGEGGGTPPPDTGVARIVSWSASGGGEWNISAANWLRPASNGGPAYSDAFRQGDIVRFNTNDGVAREITVGGAMRVSAMSVSGGGSSRFIGGSIRGVVDAALEGGNGALVKEGGGTLAFRDNTLSFDGGVSVKAGDLALENSTLNAAVEIEAGGRLVLGSTALEGVSELGTAGVIGKVNGRVENRGFITGNGIIRGEFVNKGTISPGFSAGVIEINDPGFDNTQGTLVLQIEANGAHDVIRYTGVGNLVIGGQITLDVSPQYLAEHSEGGKVVLPALLESASETDTAVLDESVTLYFTDPTLYGVFTDLSSGIAQVGRDFRHIPELRSDLGAFADALNALSSSATPSAASALVNAILAINNETERAHALANASPLGLASMTALALGNAAGDLDAVREHLDGWRLGFRDKFEPGPSAYFRANGNFAKNGNGVSSPTFDTNSYGASAGIDYLSGSPLAAGVNLSGNLGRASLHNGGGRVTQEQFRLTGYVSAHLVSRLFADVLVSGGYSEYDAKRDTVAGRNKGSTDGSDFAAAFYLVNAVTLTPEWGLKPFAGIEYATARVGAFRESDTGAGALVVDSFSQDSLRLKLGTSVDYFAKLGADGQNLRFALNLAYAYELGDTETDITAAFVGGEERKFGVKAPSTPEHALQIGPSVELALPVLDGAALQFGYTFETDFKDRTAHQLNAAFRVRF